MAFDYARATKYFLLNDFIVGFKLGLKYFFKPKATLMYPHEKGPLSPRFRGEHALRRYPNGEDAASPVNSARRSAPPRRSPSTRNRARTEAAAPRATTST